MRVHVGAVRVPEDLDSDPLRGERSHEDVARRHVSFVVAYGESNPVLACDVRGEPCISRVAGNGPRGGRPQRPIDELPAIGDDAPVVDAAAVERDRLERRRVDRDGAGGVRPRRCPDDRDVAARGQPVLVGRREPQEVLADAVGDERRRDRIRRARRRAARRRAGDELPAHLRDPRIVARDRRDADRTPRRRQDRSAIALDDRRRRHANAHRTLGARHVGVEHPEDEQVPARDGMRGSGSRARRTARGWRSPARARCSTRRRQSRRRRTRHQPR